MSEEVKNTDILLESGTTANQEILYKLDEIAKIDKKRLLYQRCMVICMAVVLFLILAVTPGMVKMIHSAQGILKNMEQTVEKADTAIDSVTLLMDESSSKMETAFDKINEIDIDTLNHAIYDLNEVVKPMADFFGTFKAFTR